MSVYMKFIYVFDVETDSIYIRFDARMRLYEYYLSTLFMKGHINPG